MLNILNSFMLLFTAILTGLFFNRIMKRINKTDELVEYFTCRCYINNKTEVYNYNKPDKSIVEDKLNKIIHETLKTQGSPFMNNNVYIILCNAIQKAINKSVIKVCIKDDIRTRDECYLFIMSNETPKDFTKITMVYDTMDHDINEIMKSPKSPNVLCQYISEEPNRYISLNCMQGILE